MAISVGDSCTDRHTSVGINQTIVTHINPANATGTIDTMSVYAVGDVAGLEYAAFAASGNDLTTNGDTNGSNLSAGAGSCTTHTAAGNDFTAFAIASGEYIGAVGTSGVLEYQTIAATDDIWYKSGDNIPCSGVTFTYLSNRNISIGGAGTESGAASIVPQTTYYYNMLKAGEVSLQ